MRGQINTSRRRLTRGGDEGDGEGGYGADRAGGPRGGARAPSAADLARLDRFAPRRLCRVPRLQITADEMTQL